VTWGRALADLKKSSSPVSGSQHDPITYTLSFIGTGEPLTLTDSLPPNTSAPYSFQVDGTTVLPNYDSGLHQITWNDAPPTGREVTIRYRTTIATASRQALVNTAALYSFGNGTSSASVTVLANPFKFNLPLAFKLE
jgi:hypothetical protein